MSNIEKQSFSNREIFEAKRRNAWVWIYITDDWIDGPIPAYKKDPEE